MSAQPPPPLSQGATDFESDSEYLGTPVDPPSTSQPHVAGYGPLDDYYCPSSSYENSSDYVAGHPATQYRYSDPEPVVAQQSFLLGQGYYEAAPSEDCTRSNGVIPYHWLGSGHAVANSERDQMAPCSQGGVSATTEGASQELGRRPDDPCAPYTAASLQYPEYHEDPAAYGDNMHTPSPYPSSRSRQPDLSVSYPLPGGQRLHGSRDDALVPSAASYAQAYYNDRYVESPIEEPRQCDPLVTSSGCAPLPSGGFDGQSQSCAPHLDTHLSASHVQVRRTTSHAVRFYQPPSCPYSYPVIDGPVLEAPGYSSDPLSVSSHLYPHSVIHAPRPQQLHDIHTLHDSTCLPGESQGRFPSHHVLSIPNGPMHPIPRPSSLIEDNPKKPLTLACFFCRKRKIACQSPPANSPDRTCNQCAKRKLKCVYPATSRRGVRPRVYDLHADDRLSRQSAPLSL
ncbi:hypothetical protein ONZ51_g2864 [Trametes cubensis]|uniref:Zn(2)-C6 fungal-type domain-containing protein n=1 Tax=Trametes cubensis TaxID=1111947 RepID=A0AAD7TYQ8_9APHY|nr:hypothetical protein ONZ51_g2864 [Trametes cubensis]